MGKVRFEPEAHKYFAGERELISVSAFTKKFEQKKDWKAIATKVAKKEGKTTKEIMDLWDMKRNKGTEAGTIVHSIKEHETLGSGVYHYNNEDLAIRECPLENNIKQSLNINEIESGHVYPELMIYDLELGICGQSDEVVIQNNTINILDFKTDKSIEYKAYSSQWVEAEKLMPPLQHLDACNYNIYSIKMSLYMYLLWKANKGRFKPGKIILKWVPIERDEQGIPVLYDEKGNVVESGGVPKILKEEWIELPYRKKEVMAMLETLKK